MKRTWLVGDIEIVPVIEAEGPTVGTFMLPDADPAAVLERHGWAVGSFVAPDGRLLTRIQALCLEADGAKIIVDTCVGNHKTRANPFWDSLELPFLEDLAAAGFPRRDVDVVICTHLHVDHVGWNTMLVDGEWVPTFPNAEYLFVGEEFAHWAAEGPEPGQDVQADSVQPVVDAGLARMVPPDHVVGPSVRLTPTPGHTPGHASVVIASAGREAVITGDLMHHAVQVATPHWGSGFDVDSDMALATRRAFIDRYADTDTTVIGTHFGGPGGGHIVTVGDEHRLVPAS